VNVALGYRRSLEKTTISKQTEFSDKLLVKNPRRGRARSLQERCDAIKALLEGRATVAFLSDKIDITFAPDGSQLDYPTKNRYFIG